MEEPQNTDNTKKSLAKKFGRYVIEIVVIFIGITISFAFDQWRDLRNNRQKEKELIHSLIIDLADKKKEIKVDFEQFKRFLKVADTSLICFYKGRELPEQTVISLHLWHYSGLWFFKTNSPTYSSSHSTGQWQQLPDSLRKSIFNVFEGQLPLMEIYYREISDRKHQVLTYMLRKEVITSLSVRVNDDILKKVDFSKLRKAFTDKEYIEELFYQCQCYRDLIIIGEDTLEQIDVLTSNLEAYLKKMDHV